MKRGEIRYITRTSQYGSEMQASTGRPAIIVSCEALAATAPVMQVVYLTTRPKRDMPEHVTIMSTGVQSTAICEQVTTVDVSLIGDLVGRCTDDEMERVGKAIAASLGLGDRTAADTAEEYDDTEEGWTETELELVETRAKLAASEEFIRMLLAQLGQRGA